MKLLFIQKIFGIAILTAIFNVCLAANASNDKYSCQKVNNVYGIYSRTDRGNLNLLNFSRDVPQNWFKNTRCKEVAKRFQRFYDNDILRLIGAGYVNNEPVLCAVKEKGELCYSENVLVTLPPESNPTESAQTLMDTRGLARGIIMDVNGKIGKLESVMEGRSYYDIEVLEEVILKQKNSNRIINN